MGKVREVSPGVLFPFFIDEIIDADRGLDARQLAFAEPLYRDVNILKPYTAFLEVALGLSGVLAFGSTEDLNVHGQAGLFGFKAGYLRSLALEAVEDGLAQPD